MSSFHLWVTKCPPPLYESRKCDLCVCVCTHRDIQNPHMQLPKICGDSSNTIYPCQSNYLAFSFIASSSAQTLRSALLQLIRENPIARLGLWSWGRWWGGVLMLEESPKVPPPHLFSASKTNCFAFFSPLFFFFSFLPEWHPGGQLLNERSLSFRGGADAQPDSLQAFIWKWSGFAPTQEIRHHANAFSLVSGFRCPPRPLLEMTIIFFFKCFAQWAMDLVPLYRNSAGNTRPDLNKRDSLQAFFAFINNSLLWRLFSAGFGSHLSAKR